MLLMMMMMIIAIIYIFSGPPTSKAFRSQKINIVHNTTNNLASKAEKNSRNNPLALWALSMSYFFEIIAYLLIK